MAVVTKKIANLPESTSVASTDVFVKETSGGVTQKITGGNLASNLNPPTMNTNFTFGVSAELIGGGLYTVGKIVILNARIKFNADVSAFSNILSGLPVPMHGANDDPSIVSTSNSLGKNVVITTAGNMFAASNATFSNGSIVTFSAVYVKE